MCTESASILVQVAKRNAGRFHPAPVSRQLLVMGRERLGVADTRAWNAGDDFYSCSGSSAASMSAVSASSTMCAILPSRNSMTQQYSFS